MATSTVGDLPNPQPKSTPKPPPPSPAHTSAYDTDPWQPVVDPTSKDYKNEEKAAKQYDAVYGGTPLSTPPPVNTPPSESLFGDVSVPGIGGVSYVPTHMDPVTLGSYAIPNLAMVYTEAPDLIPDPTLPSSGSGGGSVNLDFSTNVNLADLRAAEQACLDDTKTLIDGYNTLKPMVTSAIGSDTFFGQNVQSDSGDNYNSTYATDHPNSYAGSPVTTSDYNSEGQDFANAINPQMEQLLQQCGNILEMFGQFNALINVAGQMYAQTDATALKALLPPPVFLGGGHGPVVHGGDVPPVTGT